MPQFLLGSPPLERNPFVTSPDSSCEVNFPLVGQMFSIRFPAPNFQIVESCRCRPLAYSSSAALAFSIVFKVSATASRSLPRTTTYTSSSPRPVYTRLPIQPRLGSVPCSSAAGSAMHVGRPRARIPVRTPARSAASCSSMAPRGLHATKTTSGVAATFPSGPHTIALGPFARRGICCTSSGLT